MSLAKLAKDTATMTELSTTASTAPILSETRAAPSGVNQAVDFLQALFAPGDRILLRPIETWIEGGKKKSQTDYKGTEYHLYGLKNQAGNWCPFPNRLAQTIDRQDKRSTQTLANVFFGILPASRQRRPVRPSLADSHGTGVVVRC